jgi:FAD-dependent urate hydroxylase
MRVLISGGGVAGTVTALALHRAGIESTIFEAHAPTRGEVGSYLTIAPNGLDAIDAVGVLPLV